MKIEKSKKMKYFRVRKSQKMFVYERNGATIKIPAEKLELEVLPLAPVNLPEKLTSYFMLDFEPLLMPPKSRTIVLVKFPIEIGVYLGNRLIDVFGFAEPKFLLYGPASGGIIARDIKAEIVQEIEPSPGYAYMSLRIKNYTDDAFEVKRMLVNAEYLDLYYHQELVLTELMKLDITKDGIRVRYMNKTPRKGLSKVPAKGMLFKKEDVIWMEWGP